MPAEWLNAVEQSALAEALRFWRWAYPLASLTHVLGIALLIGAILPLDLRLLGVWRAPPPAPLIRVLAPCAGAGLALALLSGPLLFSADPHRYAALPLFGVKLALITLALLNLWLLRRSPAWRDVVAGRQDGAGVPAGVRTAALLSALCWLLTLLCGRLLAFV